MGNQRQNIRNEVAQLKKKLYTPGEGLTTKDYYRLKEILKYIKFDKNAFGFKCFNDTTEMLNLLVSSGVVYGFSQRNHDYVTHELPVLPFIFANRSKEKPIITENNREIELPIYEYHNGDQFKFHFKTDKGFEVLDVQGIRIKDIIKSDNSDKPYVTGMSNIKYISRVEDISITDATEVLLSTYNCEYEVDDYFKPIIKFYKDVLCSDEFYEFLEVGRRKAAERNLDTSFYDKMYIFIDRAIHNLPNPDFELDEVPNRLVLERK